MIDLTGKVAVISGSARGQGAAEACLLASLGAQVVVADVLDGEGRAVAATIGERAVYEHLDVTERASWERVVAAAVDAFGRLDVLVNNAGVTGPGTVADVDEAAFLRVVAVNQLGVLLGMHAVFPALRDGGGGSIVNIASTASHRGVSGSMAYTATKWAVRGMTKAAAMELGPFGIRVNSVHPGVIHTPMVPWEQLDESMRDAVVGDLPIARIGTTDDVAAMVAFLASDRSAYCTGAEFVVDGGSLAGQPLFRKVEGRD